MRYSMSETSGELETMRPNPVWTADAYEDALAIWRECASEVTVKVWGGDWCKDCRSQLPDFSAGLQAAGVEDIEHFPVETDDNGGKIGSEVDVYDIERIPTIIVEDSGEEIGRFVEEATFPILVALAEELKADT
jgi:thiol-disulfide isomerase/thioredoxin